MERQRIDRYTRQQERQTRLEQYHESVDKARNRKREVVPFVYKPFSFKQHQVLRWWQKDSPLKDCEGIIADGAIRSGKTLVFGLAYGLWAMENFNGMNFLICGKTVGSLRRNVILDWKRQMTAQGFTVKERRTDSVVIVSKGEVSNDFYLFGGSDERSQDLVQGITAAGVLFDEVALMPRSFVEQATGRCSVDGSKWWFNCNPGHPKHWFKTEWIDRLKINRQGGDEEKTGYKNLAYLHFTMDDNPSLTERVKARYSVAYTGVFYRRFILGEWCQAEGTIYDMWNDKVHVIHPESVPTRFERVFTACDYGTSNPFAAGLFGTVGNKIYMFREYYYDSARKQRQKTDGEYADDILGFLGEYLGKPVIIDPSAASFKVEMRKRGIAVRDADNDVLNGIRLVAQLLTSGRLFISSVCKETIREFPNYIWDKKMQERGEDAPVKKDDHGMDMVRYGMMYAFGFNRPETYTGSMRHGIK